MKWLVEPKDSNGWSGKRGWPSAFSTEKPGCLLFNIRCEVPYSIQRAQIGDHPPLEVWALLHKISEDGKTAYSWNRLKARPATLVDAKDVAKAFYTKYKFLFTDYVKDEK